MLTILDDVITSMTKPGEMFELGEAVVHGNKMKVWANAPNSLRDIWLDTAQHADRDYLVFKEERWTYQQAHEEVARIAHWLVKQGIRPGDRVAIAMRNYPEWILTYWAIISMGAVVVGINAWWTPEELQYGLKDSEASLLICDQERLDRFGQIGDHFPGLIVVAVRCEEVPAWATPWSEVLKSEASLPQVSIDPDSDACIFYTSGTTGFPKGAQLTHRSCVSQLYSAVFTSLSQSTANALIRGEEPPNPFAADATPSSGLISTPLFHVTALNGLVQGITVGGGKLVHMYKWDAGEALRLIEAEKITTFTGVPTMMREMILHPDFKQRNISSLVWLAGGGAPVHQDLVDKIVGANGSTGPATGYGMTETCSIICASYGVFLQNKPKSAGRLVPVCEVKTIDAEGRDLPKGEIGELCVYGPHVVKGYLNRPEATATTIVDGWLRTGDIGYIDEDDFIYLVDRIKDMVLRGGENVYCSEVENAIYKHPGIAECAVFSIPDERLGEEVGAAIYARPGIELNVDDIRAEIKTKLAEYKMPRYIWLLTEPLPRNASGKFLKKELQSSLSVHSAL